MNAAIIRDKNGSYQRPKMFAEEDHPLFKPAEVRFRLVDGLLLVGFVASFTGLVLLLAH